MENLDSNLIVSSKDAQKCEGSHIDVVFAKMSAHAGPGDVTHWQEFLCRKCGERSRAPLPCEHLTEVPSNILIELTKK